MWFVYAAAAAVCFGLRGILYQWTSQRPLQRNVLLFGVYLSGILIALAVNLAVSQPWSKPVWIGTLMGLFSFTSNAAMYKGFSVGKASLIAIFTALPPVVVVLMAYLIWGEKLNVWQMAAFAVILTGVLMIRYAGDLSLKHLQGAGWGVVAMLFFGLTDLSSKASTLHGAEPLPTLVVMYATGTLCFGFSWMIDARQARRVRAAIGQGVQEMAAASESGSKRWPVGKTLLWGMVVGVTNISGMMFILPAFKLGVTGLVSAMIAMNVVIVLLYARFGLKEKMSRLEVGGLICALIGILVLKLAG
ncbi:DMT family transporter [Paenibacillus cremeus]|uniref:DMT family transporter n=1 Tax=Paenibacillus cremeus TaxID=2163881 RepID=A0A559K840_9BACL|nr:DMT family transporter [Paenibacillus cremeus]TVY08292.1 DMT family transporter [Paenibacillus cremeus]